MKNKRVLLYVQAVLCIAVFLILTVSAVSIYLEGMYAREANPLAPVYTQEKVVHVLKTVLPLLVASAVVLILSIVFGVRGEKQNGGKLVNPPVPGPAVRHLNVVRIVVLLLSVLLVVLGIAGGGADSVLNKAVRICTECIGLG